VTDTPAIGEASSLEAGEVQEPLVENLVWLRSCRHCEVRKLISSRNEVKKSNKVSASEPQRGSQAVEDDGIVGSLLATAVSKTI
jgi:hypothetical protein